jgi:sodium/proline symporter
MSGWLLLGLPGFAYASGLQAFWLVAGLLAGGYLNWRIVARRLRIYSELAGDSLTLPAFLNNRFADSSHSLRIIGAVFTLLFYLFYTVSGLVAGGKLFSTVFGLSYEWAVIIGAATILIYTFLGGFLAVCWTDLFQGLLMLFALLLVPLIAVQEVGGWQQAYTKLQVDAPALLSLWHDKSQQPLGVIAILSLLAWGLGYFGQPHILARFKAIHSVAQIGQARRIAVTWSGLSMLGAVLVGMLGYVYFVPANGIEDSERVFMLLVDKLLPGALAGICLAAILAAIMSTADSQLLVSASVLTEDLYKIVRRRDLSQTHLMWVGRFAVLVLAGLATWLASDPESNVLNLVAYAWAGFGAAFGPTLILALYWRNMNRWGALAGMIAGGVCVVWWKQLSGGIFDLYEMVPGFVLSFASILLVSALTGKPQDEVLQNYDSMLQHCKTQ